MKHAALLLVAGALLMATLACSISIPSVEIMTGPTTETRIDVPRLADPSQEAYVTLLFGAGKLRLAPGSEGLVTGTAAEHGCGWSLLAGDSRHPPGTAVQPAGWVHATTPTGTLQLVAPGEAGRSLLAGLLGLTSRGPNPRQVGFSQSFTMVPVEGGPREIMSECVT